jgi:hypothetical protein
MKNKEILFKLTCFWAFIEAGLGGFLHLFKIPITGFVIGGFAIINLVLLVKYAEYNTRFIIQTLGVVLAVKFFLSPQSPIGAYIAVGFQGLMAALFLCQFKLTKFSVTLFALIVMLESAIQKPIMAYFVMGKDFWQASIGLVADFMHTPKEAVIKNGKLFFLLYLVVYGIFALIIANWANFLRQNIDKISLSARSINKATQDLTSIDTKPNTGKYLNIFMSAILLLLVLVLLSLKILTLTYLLQLIFTLFFLLFLVPIAIKKHQSILLNKNKELVATIANALPLVKKRTQIAWVLTKEYKGLNRIKYFVRYALWINVFYEG